MEALISRKASDSEIGLARKNLQDTIAYWGVNWNARSLAELPDYVRDQFILYTYTLWLEEQITILKEQKDDLPDRTDTPEDTKVNRGDVGTRTGKGNDGDGVADKAGLPKPELLDDKSTDAVGLRKSDSKSTNEVNKTTGEP